MDEEEEDAFVYIFDRREESDTERQKIHIGGIFSFDMFYDIILHAFDIDSDKEFVITTTSRNPINDDDTFVSLIESGDTLYLLNYTAQPLEAPVAERIEFQPHYDTLIKSGIYEYYASEGHINPLPFAFAELIDNALAATVKNKGTRFIELSLHLDESTGRNVLCVYDNGEGMSSRQLNNWAIYRLSKFNRTERHKRPTQAQESTDNGDEGYKANITGAPKSLNSDISWFGVGGKQAIFFIGNSTRIISKPRGSCDVHEFSMSKDEFRRKERNREAIFAGYIRNRKPCDSSHIPGTDEVTRRFIESESGDGFTRIVVTGIDNKHISFMKNSFDIWTRQLAHIYHYYIHGPEGNTTMSRRRRNIGALDVAIKVALYQKGKEKLSIDLHDIEDDLESKYIRTAANTMEFTAKSDGGSGGTVEGVLRYHPFLYDKETYPLDHSNEDDETDCDDGPPGRGRRPIFECYWNGRLIPYTFIDDFDWCRLVKKPSSFPPDCYYRVSGCLFTNDKFQVSTNKLTFMDLDSKLHDRATSFSRIILGEEQRGNIQRHFQEWLRECHEKYDKQIKFFKFSSSVMRNDPGSRKGQSPWTVYKAIEWAGKIFSKGQLVKTQRTVPVICGTIRRFLLYGDYDGDVFAVGGEMEVIQEPQSLYGDVRSYPLSKLDRSVPTEAVLTMVQSDESKLPATIELAWPEGEEITEGQSSQAGIAIGAMSVTILNQSDEPIQRLPSNAGNRKLIVEQRLLFTSAYGEERKPVEIASHVTAHGKKWPYWFKRIENISAVGSYVVTLQAAFTESGAYTYADGRRLPSLSINFSIKEAPPHKVDPIKCMSAMMAQSDENPTLQTKSQQDQATPVRLSGFMVGILESPLRVGEPFDIPLDMQDKFGHSTQASLGQNPILESKGLDLMYNGVEVDGHSLIIKDVIAIGYVASQQGKNFQMTVILPGLERDSQTLKIRLLPGKPTALRLTSFSDGFNKIEGDKDDTEWQKMLQCENASDISLGVEVVDVAGNATLRNKLIIQCKFTGSSGLPTWSCNCSQSGHGVLSGKLKIKRLTKPQNVKAKLEVQNSKSIKPLECKFQVIPSTRIYAIHVFYKNPSLPEDNAPVRLQKDQDIHCDAGDTIENLSFKLFDEAKRAVELNPKLASQVKVNWTGSVSTSDFEKGFLPGVVVPTNVSDTKFCQVSFASEKKVEFSFNVKPLAGEPAGLKITINGERSSRLGLIRKDTISVKLLDSFGNQLHIRPGQLELIKIECKGLDEALLTKTVEDNQVVISDIQFNEGPLGSREITVSYNDVVKEYAVMELLAGSPVTMKVTAWPDIKQKITILSGTRLQDEISIQLMDGWGNPCTESGVKVLLGKDPGIKLSPTPQVLKTNSSGAATFSRFSISAKCGDYFLQPRAIYNRVAIEGSKLAISVLPNTETPVTVKHQCMAESNVVVVGGNWPAYLVNVLSEEGVNVTSTIHLCMAIWKGKPNKDKSVPSSAEWHRTVTTNGKQLFQNIKAPTVAGDFFAMFGVASSATSKSFTLSTDVLPMKTTPGPPVQLCPHTEPGTPTVSNSKFNRVIIRNLKLLLKDEFGNLTGLDLNGNVVVTIQPCDQSLKSSEVPTFEGMCSRLHIPLKDGEVSLQNLTLQENSPGVDESQYTLHCELNCFPPISVPAYMLKFLFYNDARKHAQMSALARQRDELIHAIKMYKETFSAHKSLLDELQTSRSEALSKRRKMISDLRGASIAIDDRATLKDVEQLVELCATERDTILQRPRRQCALQEYPDAGSDVLGKIGHLTLVRDPHIANVLSWHMSGDMDCLITITTKKAREVHRLTGGSQQVLPLDSIYRKNLPDWKRPLPHLRGNAKIKRIPGNPVYARDMLEFVKDEDNCKIVFGMLLGDTLILDDLDAANEYRKLVVKTMHCPTILTRNGDRIRSNGKFGGNQNRAPPMERLRGVVFGAPIPEEYSKCCRQIEMLNDFKSILSEVEAAEDELAALEESMSDDEMRKKESEMDEAKERLKTIEKKIGLSKGSSVPPRQDMESEAPKKKKSKR